MTNVADVIPAELARKTEDVIRDNKMDQLERVALRIGIRLTLKYVSDELEALKTALMNARPPLLDIPQTVRR